MKQCTTHHYACDCREERIRMILRTVLMDHMAIQKLLAGFGKFKPCTCGICKTIRELYPYLENEGVDRFHKHVAVWEVKHQQHWTMGAK